MGYHAPRAEDVYRYIFRLDNSRSGLSDGFSWSILLVNDGSATCKEFLAQYGAELCHRTADRIRFVFFSGLSTEETAGLANEANNRGGGFLARIINAASTWRPSPRRFDWERDPWERYRPEAFRPLDSGERITQHINMECEINSAMPGSEEAFRLAQRLGIGRFVPCFLLFSDIGSPVVYVYPVGHQSPEQIFERLRVWVDSFYEINHSTLSRWTEIENSIEQTSRALRLSLDKVERWKRDQEDRWKQLQKLSRVLYRLENSRPEAGY